MHKFPIVKFLFSYASSIFMCFVFSSTFFLSFTWVFWSLWDFYAHGQRRSLRPTDQFPGENGIRRQGRNTIQVVTTSKVFLPQNCIVYRKKYFLSKVITKHHILQYLSLPAVQQTNKSTKSGISRQGRNNEFEYLGVRFSEFFSSKKSQVFNLFSWISTKYWGEGSSDCIFIFQIRTLGERLIRRSRRSNSKRWLFSAFEDSPRISLEAEASFWMKRVSISPPQSIFLQPIWGALSSISFDRKFDEWLKHNCGVYVKYTQKALAVAKQRQVVGWVNKGDENQRNSLLLASSCFSGFL